LFFLARERFGVKIEPGFDFETSRRDLPSIGRLSGQIAAAYRRFAGFGASTRRFTSGRRAPIGPGVRAGPALS